MTDARVSLPAESWVSEDGKHSVAVTDGGEFLAHAQAPTAGRARKELARHLLGVLRDHELRERNTRRAVLVTNEGSLFVVEFRHGGWGYAITRKDARHSSSVGGPEATFDETLVRARRHAETGFGGVAFEAPL